MEKQEKQEPKRLGGFYIALCCCVIAVGVAGYFTERNTENDISKPAVNEGIPESEIVSNEETTEAVSVSEINENIEYDTAEQANAVDFPEVEVFTPESVPANAPTDTQDYSAENNPAPAFAMPIEGEILEEFSKELTYNNALCDWRAHTGVDIGSEIGSSVNSIADGTVLKISSDEMGKYIEIDHGNGFTARYSRLLSTEGCEEGKKIKKGEVIGTICESNGENVSAPHLHLELYKDNSVVNPMEYIN